MMRTLLFLGLFAATGCQKTPILNPCYTCASFVQYKSNLSTFNAPDPYNYKQTVCNDADKDKLQGEHVKVEPITKTTSLSTITTTICARNL